MDPGQIVDAASYSEKSPISHKHPDKDLIINKVLQTASNVYSRILTPELPFMQQFSVPNPSSPVMQPDPGNMKSGFQMQKRTAVAPESTRCSTCMLSAICLPLGMARSDVIKMDELIKERIRLTKGTALYHLGDEVEAIYGIRSGSIKTQLEDAAGQVQITGFLLPGEILGMDGLMENEHVSHAIALEDSEVCVIRLDEMDQLAPQLPSLQIQLRRLMSKEINRSHQLLMSVGGLRSEQRLAAFLMNLSQRLATLGYSPHEFLLRMSREEIGNFLGLTLETVSRLFSRFAREGLIRVRQREVQILDINALQALSGSDCA